MEQLRVWNFTHSSEIPTTTVETAARFSTCLRTLYFSFSECAELGPEHLSDRKAYEFLLRVLCGLESPVFGETEVLGQFKTQMETFPKELQSLVQMILADVKTVRHLHLTGLGGSSYGSLTREFFGKSESLVMIGAGHLAQEIYPWLAKTGQAITIGVRSLRPFGPALQSKTEVRKLQDIQNRECDLVLAAPISDQELQTWILENKITVKKCLDFRASQQSSEKCFGLKSMNLDEIFETLRRNREDHSQVREMAMAEIEILISKRTNQASLRPFGWEDLCV